MLLTYQYPVNHQMEALNSHFFEFLTSIRNVRPTAQFRPSVYFNVQFLEIVNSSPKLKLKLGNFFSTFKVLSQDKKDAFYNLVVKSQNIQNFFTDNTIDCIDVQTINVNSILGNNSFNILVSHLFSITLKSLDIKNHYKLIYDAMPHKVCPFCGVEKMHKSFQEDYDHLAAKRHYPIVAINMKNLAPMCHTCNSKNKGEKDVLNNANGTRKLFTYPYSQTVDVSIDFSNCIIPYTDEHNPEGNWDIALLPDNSIISNWDLIFNIKKRYKEDYLECCFEDWLDEFLDGLILYNVPINNEQHIIDQLIQWSQNLHSKKFYNINFIKAPLFSYLSGCGINSFYLSLLARYNQKLAVA